jgi:hypothetical protein
LAQALDESHVEMIEAQTQIDCYCAGGLRPRVADGDIDPDSFMAGRSPGISEKRRSLSDILATLIDKAALTFKRRGD